MTLKNHSGSLSLTVDHKWFQRPWEVEACFGALKSLCSYLTTRLDLGTPLPIWFSAPDFLKALTIGIGYSILSDVVFPDCPAHSTILQLNSTGLSIYIPVIFPRQNETEKANAPLLLPPPSIPLQSAAFRLNPVSSLMPVLKLPGLRS